MLYGQVERNERGDTFEFDVVDGVSERHVDVLRDVEQHGDDVRYQHGPQRCVQPELTLITERVSSFVMTVRAVLPVANIALRRQTWLVAMFSSNLDMRKRG